MTILDSFKKWASRWGKEVIGDNISEMVSNFADNLPFGETTKMIEIIPLTEVEITEKGYDNYAGYIYGITIPSPAENEIFEVIFDGKKYTLTSSVIIGDEYDLLAIGNRCITSNDLDDTGEPFYIEHGFDSSLIEVYTPEPGNHTISISRKYTVVRPLDSKFIGGADMVIEVQGGPDVILSDTNTSVISGSIDNIFNAFSEGRQTNVKIAYKTSDTMVEVNSVTVYQYDEEVYIDFVLCGTDGDLYSRSIGLGPQGLHSFGNRKFSGTAQ